MVRFLSVLVLFLCLCALHVCGCPSGKGLSDAQRHWSPSTTVKTVREKEATIHVTKGESFQIQLSSNPTTGYTWLLTGQQNADLTAQPILPQGITLNGCKYERTQNNANANGHGGPPIGMGGADTWGFTVSSTAQSGSQITLKLRYARPWEKNSNVDAADASYTLIVQ